MATPVSGPVALLKVNTTTVPAMDWKLSIDAKLKDVSNFADGRKQKATLSDADFSAKVLWDADDMPHDPAGLGLTAGAEVTAKGYVSSTLFYSIPIIIGKIDIESEIEGVLMYNVSAKLNGAIVEPVITP